MSNNNSSRPGELFQQNRNSGGGDRGMMRRQSSQNELGGSGNSSYRNHQHHHRDRDSDYYYNPRGSGGGGGGGGGSSHSHGNTHRRSFHRSNSNSHNNSNHRNSYRNLQEMPVEQGRIHTLLDNFGFIFCANRPTDIFFHYSEFRGYSDDLNIGDEVQFHVGARSSRGGSGGGGDDNGEEQLSAYGLTVLEPGTVQWEVEDEPVGMRRRGKVERTIRFGGGGGGGGNNVPEGTIRLLELEDNEASTSANASATEPELESESNTKDDEKQEKRRQSKSKKKGGLVRYKPDDYKSSNNHNNNHHYNRSRSKSRGDHLDRNDLVEFILVTEKRSGLKYARNITLVQSERARLEEERERKMLERATTEQGIVVSLKNGYGFLKSNCRKEQVYFHFSQVMEKVKEEEGDAAQSQHGASDPHTDDNNHDNSGSGTSSSGGISADGGKMPEIGQEVEFLVVQENDPRDRDRKKISARKVQVLPKGSVLFEQVVGMGVKGILTMNPNFAQHPTMMSNDRERGDRRISGRNKGILDLDGGPGTIKLCKPISFAPAGGEKKNQQAQDVSLIEVTSISLQPADCLGYLKDEPKPEMWFKIGDTLMFDVVYDVVDGACRAVPTKHGSTGNSGKDDNSGSEKNARIKLLAPSLAGRAEGTIASIKDNYGFVQLAHRNMDVYFRLSDVFPTAMQKDFLDCNFHEGDDSSNNLVVGSEVTFDLSLLPPKHKPGRNSNRHGRRGVEKEQMRAQRLAILPAGTVRKFKVDEEVTGIVMQVNRYNLFAGQIRLNKKIKEMSQEEKHPLVTKLIRRFLSDHGEDMIYFQDVQSEIENDIILEAVRGKSSLEVRFTPVSDFGDNHRGRVCICKVKKDQGESVPDPGPALEVGNDPSNIDTTTCSQALEIEGEASDANDDGDKHEVDQNFDMAAADPDTDIKDATDGATTPSKKATSKKKMRSIKAITFDRGSLSPEYIADPPRNGDEVSLMVTFCRATGDFMASNMSLTKRQVPVEKEDSSKAVKYNQCEGYVLLEPVHTSFKESKSSRRKGFEGGGWNTEEKDMDPNANSHDDGIILLLKDPAGLYKLRSKSVDVAAQVPVDNEDEDKPIESVGTDLDSVSRSESNINQMVALPIEEQSPGTQHIFYTVASTVSRNSHDTPKRGDLVVFSKGKGGKAREVKVEKKAAASKLKGILTNLDKAKGTAIFQSAKGEEFDVYLSDVVSCDIDTLKNNDAVEGIRHSKKIIGICRNADLYLESTIGSGSAKKERPKLNLTVKRELKGLGGRIIAQSGMAKGPDGTNGFASGWTSRMSKFTVKRETVLSVTAEEFTPASSVTSLEVDNEKKELMEAKQSTTDSNGFRSEATSVENMTEPQGQKEESSKIPAS